MEDSPGAIDEGIWKRKKKELVSAPIMIVINVLRYTLAQEIASLYIGDVHVSQNGSL